MKEQDRLDAYLNGAMGPEERASFEAELRANPPLRELADLQRVSISALERGWLRKQMKAGSGFFRLQIITLIALLITSLGLGWVWLLRQPAEKSIEHKTALSQAEQPPVNETLPRPVETRAPTPIRWADTAHRTKVATYPTVKSLPALAAWNAAIPPLPAYSADTLPVDMNKPETFEISNLRDTQLVTLKGLRVFVPANSLLMPDGTYPALPVQLNITYYSDYFDLWAGKVSTKTAEDSLLVTGGSCKISAFCQGQRLSISQKSAVVLQFPGERDSLMQTFYGNRDSIGELSWDSRPAATFMPPAKWTVQVDSVYSKTVYYFTSDLQDNIPSSAGAGNGISCDLDSSVIGYFDSFNSLDSDIIEYLYHRKQKLQLGYQFRNNQFRGFDFTVFARNKKEKRMERQIQRFAKKLPAPVPSDWEPESAENGVLNVRLTPAMRELYTFDTLVRIDSTLQNTIKEKLEMKNFNTLVIRNFGYVNCDFFYPGNANTTSQICGAGNADNVHIFFLNSKAAIKANCKSGTCTITGIPSDEPVLLVCLEKSENGLIMRLSESQTADRMECGPAEPFQTEKLRQFLIEKLRAGALLQ